MFANDDKTTGSTNPWVASNQAYEAAQKLLECLIDPDPAEIACNFPAWTKSIGAHEYLLVRPLADALRSDDPVRQAAAAAALLLADKEKLGPDACTLKECVRILGEFLTSGPSDRQAWCCRTLLFLHAPPELEAALRRHSKSTNRTLSAYASAALATINAADSSLIHTLSAGLRNDNHEIVLASATALARLGVRAKESLKLLADCLYQSNAEGQLAILVALKQIGTDAAPIGSDLLTFLNDGSQSDVVRGYCADVIGNILDTSSGAVAALSSLVSSDNRFLVLGAIGGLCAIRAITDDGMDALLSLLESDDEDVRIGAIIALGKVGRGSEQVVSTLLSRLDTTNGIRESDELIWTLSRLGPTVVPAIFNALREWDISRAWLAAGVVSALPDAELESFVGHVQSSLSEFCLIVLAAMSQRVGPRIKPAVPLFAQALDNAWDDDTAFHLLTAIECAGSSGVPALPSVVRYLLVGTEYQSQAAERVLVNLGQDSIPAIRLARSQSESSRSTARLDMVLARIEGNAIRNQDDLAEIDDRLLISFMYVAGCRLSASDNGRPIGLKRIETIINSKNTHRADRRQVKEATLRDHLVKLREALGGKDLFDGQTGGKSGRLSTFACDLFPRVLEYLHAKYPPDHFLNY